MNKKKVSKNKILKELYFEDNLSCAAICLKISKSFPLTAKLLEELICENLIIETGFAPSTGGRRPLTYSLKKNILYLVAVAIDQFVTKIAIVDMQNNIVLPIENIVLPLFENKDALEILKGKLLEVITSSGIPIEKFVGVGIGMPGFVDVKKGINYSFLNFKNNESITKNIEEKIGIPVFIDNDSSLIALAELRFGTARGKKMQW